MNPAIDMVLQMGLPWFIATKSLGIGLCVALLTLTKNHRLARVGLGIILVG